VKLRGLSPFDRGDQYRAGRTRGCRQQAAWRQRRIGPIAASLVKQAIATARSAGATGQILVRVRGDSAFGSGPVVSACRRAGVNFSLTVQSNPKMQAAVDSIEATAWTPVRYPGAVYDEQIGQWISNAEVAETTYTAFETTSHKVTARLIVRRVREVNPAPPGQEELFPTWRYHAFLTDTDQPTATADLIVIPHTSSGLLAHHRVAPGPRRGRPGRGDDESDVLGAV
jgi:hypothetical protein